VFKPIGKYLVYCLLVIQNVRVFVSSEACVDAMHVAVGGQSRTNWKHWYRVTRCPLSKIFEYVICSRDQIMYLFRRLFVVILTLLMYYCNY
jgi:hypothetical protein